MIEIYKDLGLYYEGLVNVVRKGRTGAEEIVQMMKNFRENPPQMIAGSKVATVQDYLLQTEKNVMTGEEKPMTGIAKSNVLIYYTEDGTKVCVRPSGTEPKIKFYVSVQDSISDKSEYEEKTARLMQRIDQVKQDLNL